MLRSKAIFLLVILFTILGYASLFAQGSVLCSYCNKGITSGKYYCTHCGTWWISPDNIIQSEFGLGTSYDKVDYNDLVYTDTMGTPTGEKVSADAFSIQASFKYYINSRYQHPMVPFSFRPYNYRSNFIECGASIHNVDGLESMVGSNNVYIIEQNSELKSLWFSGAYHFNKLFLGGNISYLTNETDFQYRNNGSDHTLTIGGIGGYYNSQIKIGLEFQYKDEKEEQGDWEDQKQYISLKPLVEYLPFPTLMLSGGINYLFETDGDFYEYLIPVQLKLVTVDNWWEFEISSSYYNSKYGNDKFDVNVEIEKLFRNSSVFIRPEIRRDAKDTYTRIVLGVNRVLMNRKLMATITGYYGSDRDINIQGYDINKYGGNVSLKAYF